MMLCRPVEPARHGREHELVLGSDPVLRLKPAAVGRAVLVVRERDLQAIRGIGDLRPSSFGRRHPCRRSSRRPGLPVPPRQHRRDVVLRTRRTAAGRRSAPRHKLSFSPASVHHGRRKGLVVQAVDVIALDSLRLCRPNDLKGVRVGATSVVVARAGAADAVRSRAFPAKLAVRAALAELYSKVTVGSVSAATKVAAHATNRLMPNLLTLFTLASCCTYASAKANPMHLAVRRLEVRRESRKRAAASRPRPRLARSVAGLRRTVRASHA